MLITGDCTVQLSVKLLESGTTQTLFMTGTTSKPAGNRLFGMVHGYVANRFTADHEHSGGTNVLSSFSNAADVAVADLEWAWHHLALVRDTTANTYTLYIDGVPQTAVNYGTDPTGGASGSIWLGCDETGNFGNVGAIMGNFAVYNSALSASQVAYHADRVLGGMTS